MVTLPSTLKVNVMPPCGTGSAIPPVVALLPVHSPTIVGSFLGASLGPGAPRSTASPSTRVVCMTDSDRNSILLDALQGHDDHAVTCGRLEFLRPFVAAATPIKTQGQRVAVNLVDAENRRFLLGIRWNQVDLRRVLFRIDLVGPGVRSCAGAFHDGQYAIRGEGNRDAALRNGQIHSTGNRLLANPFTDDRRFFLGRILWARGRDQQRQPGQDG